jgi:hypothetical protein
MEARESTCFTGVVAPGVAKVGLVFPRVSAGAGLIWKSNHKKARNRSTGCFSLQARAAIRGVRSQNAHACSESLARARFRPKRYKKLWGADLRGKGYTVYEALRSIWRDAPAMRGCSNV